jgi:hypothetical protein
MAWNGDAARFPQKQTASAWRWPLLDYSERLTAVY